MKCAFSWQTYFFLIKNCIIGVIWISTSINSHFVSVCNVDSNWETKLEIIKHPRLTLNGVELHLKMWMCEKKPIKPIYKNTISVFLLQNVLFNSMCYGVCEIHVQFLSENSFYATSRSDFNKHFSLNSPDDLRYSIHIHLSLTSLTFCLFIFLLRDFSINIWDTTDA